MKVEVAPSMVCLLLFAVGGASPAATVAVKSPNEAIQCTVAVEGGRLAYRVVFRGRPVIETSPLGIAVAGVDLGQGATLGKAESYKTNEKYPWRGVHSEAVNHSNGARISVKHAATRTPFTVDIRVFDDAVAFRFVVPGRGLRVADAASGFRLPEGSTIWRGGSR